MAGLWRDFSIRETGTGQQVAQLHDIYDDDDDDDDDDDKKYMIYTDCTTYPWMLAWWWSN